MIRTELWRLEGEESSHLLRKRRRGGRNVFQMEPVDATALDLEMYKKDTDESMEGRNDDCKEEIKELDGDGMAMDGSKEVRGRQNPPERRSEGVPECPMKMLTVDVLREGKMLEKKSRRKKTKGLRKRKGASENIGTITDFFTLKLKSIEKDDLPQTNGVKRKACEDNENDDGDDAFKKAKGLMRSSELRPEHAPRGAQFISKKIRRDKTDSSQWEWFMGDGLKKGMGVKKPLGNRKEGGRINLRK